MKKKSRKEPNWLYKPEPITDSDYHHSTTSIDFGPWFAKMNYNNEQIKRIDKEQKAKKTILGRFIFEPAADGIAVYQIIAENKKTCRIRACVGIGNGWVFSYWGEEATIPRDYVLAKLD